VELKLPKGVKRMREEASEEVLEKALTVTSVDGFNGYIRTTAPKGVREAGIVLFLEGSARIGVYQSPERSLYGPDALLEIKRIVGIKGATIRVEEFLAQTMDDVKGIVAKMAKARLDAKHMKEKLRGKAVTTHPLKKKVAPSKVVKGAPKDTETDKPLAPVRVGKVRAKVADRITKSKEATKKDEAEDEDLLRMLKEVGMGPPDEVDEEIDEDVAQYIAAFEDFMKGSEEGESRAAVQATAKVAMAVDEILEDMMETASDDPNMMEFIESQRDHIMSKLASTNDIDVKVDKRDRLSDQQHALEHISKTFQEVLSATEDESLRRRERLEQLKAKGEGDTDAIEQETNLLDEDQARVGTMEDILAKVLDTHKERLEDAEEDLLESEPPPEQEQEPSSGAVDLEKAKEGFITQMRTRIRTVADSNGAPSKPGKVAEAVHDVSDGLHDQVEELEQEHEILTRESKRIEDAAEELEDRKEALEIDQELEVKARLDELEEKESSLRKEAEDLLAKEGKLGDDRDRIEDDLAKAREELERVGGLEKDLHQREAMLKAREEELDGKHQEVDGLKEHLEQEIMERLNEVEETEGKLKAREMELVARETEVKSSLEATKEEIKEDEADIERIQEMEAQLKKRENEYSSTITNMEKVIEALREELRDNIEKVEDLEDQLGALTEAEERVKELEEALEEAAGADSETSDAEKDDLRKLLAYLDDLLSNLPDKEIKKFSDSEYFELYGRI
jgi:hypothetical protein